MIELKIKMGSVKKDTDISNKKNTAPSDELPKIEDTAILEYFDLIKNEYDIERKRKESFENRAGIMFGFIGTFSVFILDKLKISEILALFTNDLNFLLFLKIVFGLGIYVLLILALSFLLYVIKPNLRDNYKVSTITPEKFTKERIKEIKNIIITYRDIITNHRDQNKNISKAYSRAIWLLLASVISMIVYASMGGIK